MLSISFRFLMTAWAWALLWGSVTSTHAATTNYVTTTADSGLGSLRQAILDVNESGGGTIRFSNVTGTILVLSNLPAVTANMRLIGPGSEWLTIAITNYPTNSATLSFDHGTSEVSRLTFTNATVANRAHLTLRNCRFDARPGYLTANARSTAVENQGTLMLQSCVVANRTAWSQGGGIYNSGQATLQDSMFVRNAAVGRGGASSQYIWPPAQPGGEARGGAIYGGALTIQRCWFSRNRARGGNGGQGVGGNPGYSPYCASGGSARGGAIYGWGLVVHETVFEFNEAEAGRGGDGYSGGWAGESRGGAIQGNGEFQNCLFSANRTIGARAGGGYRGGGGLNGLSAGGAMEGTGSFVNCTFSGNVALGGMGDQYHNGNQTIPYSGGQARGGALHISNATARLLGCTLVGNQAAGLPGESYSDFWLFQTLYGLHGIGYGGGVCVSGTGRVEMANSIVAQNTAVEGRTNWSATVASDGFGAFASTGYNLIGVSSNMTGLVGEDVVGVDPRLGPLQDNGGFTSTHALLTGSPAIDHGTNAGIRLDGRGQPRTVDDPDVLNVPGGDGTDIGAVEANPVLTATETRRVGNDILVRFTTTSARLYGVQARSEAGNGPWTTLGGMITGTGGIVTYIDANAATLPRRFYRAFAQVP